ncbi:MAG: PKD domain-containing protein [Planctomycetota bacterium]|nr:PKD domain-containing protein [Planctomycetota bacterium]
MLLRSGVLLFLCGPLLAAPPPWKLGAWGYRKQLRIIPGSRKEPLRHLLQGGLATTFKLVVNREKADSEIDAALLRFSPDGNCKSDGSDIRIVDTRGKEVPYQIVYVNPVRQAIVRFKVIPGQDKFLVYYGNPKAEKREYDWVCRRGLFLETRPCPKGLPKSLADMRKLVAKAKSSYGAQYNMWVFNQFNPLGPTDRYMVLYDGWINCPVTGEYKIGTVSDGPSFLVLDGKLAVQKLGTGQADRANPDTAQIQLTKGIHHIEYLAGGMDDAYRVTAVWQPPSGKQLDVIRYDFYPRVLSAESIAAERKGAPFALDFSEKVRDSIPLESGQANGYVFTNKTTRKSKRGRLHYEWDFGDGITSSEESPSHVYFEVGDYTIKLTATDSRGHKETITRSVRIENYDTVSHERQHIIDSLQTGAMHLEEHHQKGFLEIPASEIERVAKQFLEIVQTYTVESANIGTLKGMARLYRRMESTEGLVEVSRTLLNRFPDAPPEVRANTMLRLGDLLLNTLNKVDDAQFFFESLVALRGQIPDAVTKIGFLNLGRLYLSKGMLDQARTAFLEAASLRTSSVRWQIEQMRIGGLEISVMAALNQGKYAAARETLDDWERKFPKDALRGRTSFLRAKSYYLDNRLEQAVHEFGRSMTANAKAPWSPELFFTLGQIHFELKQYTEAAKPLQKLFEEYPKSQQIEEARKLWKKVKRKL